MSPSEVNVTYVPRHDLSIEPSKVSHGLFTNAPLQERERDVVSVNRQSYVVDLLLCPSSSPEDHPLTECSEVGEVS